MIIIFQKFISKNKKKEHDDQPINFAASNFNRLRNDKFIGRQDFLTEIKEAFDKTKIVILSGESGIGKTQLALEYGYLLKQQNNNYVHMIEKNDDVVLNSSKMDKLIEYLNDLNEKEMRVLLIFEIKDQIIIRDPIEKVCVLPNVFILITSTDDTLISIINSRQLPIYLNSTIIHLEPFKNDESINFIKKNLEDKVKKNLLTEIELDNFINIFDFNSNNTLPRTLDELIKIFNFNPIMNYKKKIEDIKLGKNKKILELITNNLLTKKL